MLDDSITKKDLVDFQIHVGAGASHELRNAVKIDVQNVSFWYGSKQALTNIDLKIYEREVTALIGPSGCGKSTLLRCLNRSNDLIRGIRMEGRILLDGKDINDADVDPPMLRRRFGWVAQKPNPFPWSIWQNVAYGPQILGLARNRRELNDWVEACLRDAGLWDEVKDRLSQSGAELSGGQQQRLCVARAISTRPDVLLMDEPASALDPTATAKLEDLIDRLKHDYSIVIVTHSMQQAARISQRVAMFHMGSLVEVGDASEVFINPVQQITRDYVTGRFG